MLKTWIAARNRTVVFDGVRPDITLQRPYGHGQSELQFVGVLFWIVRPVNTGEP